MSDLNDLSITGRLAKDAELREVGANNTLILKFTVANNTGWGSNETATFFDCQLWGKRGEPLKQYMTKGRQVACKGSIKANKWTGSDGVVHNDMIFEVTDVVLLAAPQGLQPQVPQEQQPPSGAATMEEIVF